MKRREVELRIRIISDLPLQELLRVHKITFMEQDGCESWIDREDGVDADGVVLDKIISAGARELDDPSQEW